VINSIKYRLSPFTGGNAGTPPPTHKEVSSGSNGAPDRNGKLLFFIFELIPALPPVNLKTKWQNV